VICNVYVALNKLPHINIYTCTNIK